MQINKVNNFSYQLIFQSSRARVLDEAGRVINCHYTNLNREDINWGKLVKMLDMRYLDQPLVKINIFGCSDASDVYTLELYLKRYLGSGADKFKIAASDISSDMIENVKKGQIMLHDKDLNFLNSIDGQEFFMRDYSAPVETVRGVDLYKYSVHPDLRKNIIFSVKDVREESKYYDFSNEVFMFRNGWTFMDLDSQNNTIKNLSKNCNNKTLFVIGQSDLFKSNACEFFQKNGLSGIESDVYTAAETDYPSVSIGVPKEKSKYPEFILFEKK